MSINDVGRMEIPIDSWCRTSDRENVDFRFAWTIEGFSKRLKDKETLTSDKFTVSGPPANMETKWRLKVNLGGGTGNGIPVTLGLDQKNTHDFVEIRCMLSILDASRRTIQQTSPLVKQFTRPGFYGST